MNHSSIYTNHFKTEYSYNHSSSIRKMATLDDVFYCHEIKRNDHVDAPCSINIGDNYIEKLLIEYDVFQHTDRKTVKRVEIFKSVQENLRVKRYIKKGEECPICLEGIFHRKDAFLTDCGHCFHATCFQTSMSKGPRKTPRCAMCRGIVYPPNKNRYPFSRNSLDILEDFWANIEMSIPEVCISRHKHWAGMNTKCRHCQNWRKM